MDFQITTEGRPGVTVVTVDGELDIATAPELAAVLDGLQGSSTPVSVDLTGTVFLDSTGVRTLANASRALDGFSVVCPAGNLAVTRVLELTGFAEALTVHESVADLDRAPTD